MKDDPGLVESAPPPTGEARPQAVGVRQLYRWFAPWITGLSLVAAGLLGLFAASAAQGSGDFAAGLVTFFLAMLAFIRGIRNYFDGVSAEFWSPVLVVDPSALLLLIALLAGLAILGLVLAARAEDALWRYIGYALFVASIAMIAWNLKHYFDWRERKDEGDSRSMH